MLSQSFSSASWKSNKHLTNTPRSYKTSIWSAVNSGNLIHQRYETLNLHLSCYSIYNKQCGNSILTTENSKSHAKKSHISKVECCLEEPIHPKQSTDTTVCEISRFQKFRPRIYNKRNFCKYTYKPGGINFLCYGKRISLPASNTVTVWDVGQNSSTFGFYISCFFLQRQKRKQVQEEYVKTSEFHDGCA